MKAWVWKSCTFDAAHTLPLHKGKCSKLHGHTYTVEIGILGRIEPTEGMVVDMGDLGDFLQCYVVAPFDHSNLNDMLQGVQPTAENIACFVLEKADTCFVRGLAHNIKVRVYETATSWVEVERAAA